MPDSEPQDSVFVVCDWAFVLIIPCCALVLPILDRHANSVPLCVRGM